LIERVTDLIGFEAVFVFVELGLWQQKARNVGYKLTAEIKARDELSG
jgi:hypothetical protein